MATLASRNDDIRDFSIGRVFSRASATVARNPLVTLSAALLLGAIPAFLISLLFRDVLGGNLAGASADMSIGVMMTSLLLWVATMVIGALVQAALTRATVAQSEGRQAGFMECAMAGIPVILPLLVLVLLWTGGIGLGTAFFIIPGIILLTMWAVAVPALVEERQGIFAAFSRSRMLTRGDRWKILGVMIILLGAYLLLILAMGAIGVSTIDLSAAPAEGPAPLSLLNIVGSLIPSTVFSLVWGTIQAAMYIELRDAKESGSADNLQEVFA